MKRNNENFFNKLSPELLEHAIIQACRRHFKKKEVRYLMKYKEKYAKIFYKSIINGTWEKFIKYKDITKINENNGKVRKISTPSLITRVYQHLLLIILEPIYNKKDNLNGLNCKVGCGVASKKKKNSVIKKMKHIFYDLTDYNYYLVIDQRKCYEHVKIKKVRKAIKKLVSNKWLIDFTIKVCFYHNNLPIGTPTSPLIHHILLLEFDYFVRSLTPYSIRYADDNFLAFKTKEEANTAKWRIMNFWWYNLGIRAKRHNLIISPFSKSLDFCGYVFTRNPDKKVTDKNKGFTKIRPTVAKKILTSKSKSWASYNGLILQSDNQYLKNKLMTKLKDLVNIKKLERVNDHPVIPIDSLVKNKILFVIKDYDIRYDKSGSPSYIKLIILIRENIDDSGNIISDDNPFNTNKVNIRIIQGNFKNIYDYLILLEKQYSGKQNLLPITGVKIINSCGYILENSTNLTSKIEITDEQFEDYFGPDTK